MTQNATISEELSKIVKMNSTNLYEKIKMIQRDDDGITFGRKTMAVLESWKSICLQKEDVTKSIKKLYRECMKDSELAIKTAALMSSAKLMNETLHGENLKTIFINHLHRKFNEVLRKDGDGELRALTNLLGCFIFKTKGSSTDFLINPLMRLIENLAKSSHTEDVRIFAIQAYLNGHNFKSENNTKWCNILTDVRLRLLNEENQDIKLWLLVGIETGTIADAAELSGQFSLLKEDKQFMEHHADVLEAKEEARLQNLFAKSKESMAYDKKEVIQSSEAKKENISPSTLNQNAAANNKKLDPSDLRLKLNENKRTIMKKSKLASRLDAIRNK